jgi:integrase
MGDGGVNPVKGLTPSKKLTKQQEKQIRPFTDAELLAVFGAPAFVQQRDTQPARYWIALLGLFQVCRCEEAAQLALKDIGEDNGIPFMNITNLGEDQSVKNDGSKRKLPIHSSLIALGFLDYVQTIRAEGHARLFPQLPQRQNGYSDAVGKFFARLLDKVGLSDPLLVFHSLRHSGIHNLQKAGCPHHIEEIISGHAASGTHDRTYDIGS